jgi:WD40 repeat protein
VPKVNEVPNNNAESNENKEVKDLGVEDQKENKEGTGDGEGTEDKPKAEENAENPNGEGGGAPNEEQYYNQESTLNALCFTPDGNFVVDCDLDKNILIYNIPEKKLEKKLKRPSSNMAYMVAFTENSELMIACYYDAAIYLWDWKKETIIMNLYGNILVSL